jgi:hypothetical protein
MSPESAVPPLSAEEEATCRWAAAAFEREPNGHLIRRLLATLDAARASAPISLAALAEALGVLHADAVDAHRDAMWRYGVRHALAVIEASGARAVQHGWFAATLRATPTGIDIGRMKQAVTNIAVRHGVVKDPPAPDWSLMHLYGYSAAPADMDAEIAAEYDRLTGDPS